MERSVRAVLLAAALMFTEVAGSEDRLNDIKRLQEMLTKPREGGWEGREARRAQTLQMQKELKGMFGAGGRPREERPDSDQASPLELPVEKAQSLTEALIAALRKKHVQDVMTSALSPSIKALTPVDRRKALAPIHDKFARPVLKRFALSGGLQDAVDSATATMRSTQDMDLAGALEELDEVVTGQRSTQREGRTAHLDRLARGFLAMPACDRRASLEEAEEALGQLGSAAHPASEEYLEAMRGVLETDHDNFIEDRVVEIRRRLQDDAKGAEGKGSQDLEAQLNVLAQFLGPVVHQQARSRNGRAEEL